MWWKPQPGRPRHQNGASAMTCRTRETSPSASRTLTRQGQWVPGCYTTGFRKWQIWPGILGSFCCGTHGVVPTPEAPATRPVSDRQVLPLAPAQQDARARSQQEWRPLSMHTRPLVGPLRHSNGWPGTSCSGYQWIKFCHLERQRRRPLWTATT